MDRYEQLRRRILDGEPSGWQLGLGVLAGRGVAGWLRVLHTTTLASPSPSPVSTSTVGSDQVVGVLAAMALACIEEGR